MTHQIRLLYEPKNLLTIMGGDAGGTPSTHLLLALLQTLPKDSA